MSDLPFREYEPSTVLVLRIDNRKPVALGLLASAFDAMARDYKQGANRELAVWEVRRGSIIATLMELSQSAEAANHLIEFAKHVGGLSLVAIGGAVAILKSKRRRGAKTVLALAEIAMKGEADVRLIYREYGREEVTMIITPSQGAYLRKRAPQLGHEPTDDDPSAEDEVNAQDALAEELAKAVRDQKQPPSLPSASQAPDLMPPLVQVLVEELRHQPGGAEVLSRVAKRLRAEGREAAARMLER